MRGTSVPPNAVISNGGTLNFGGGITSRALLGTDDLMRAHLVKAAWDNDNSMERMTQWNTNAEEVEWEEIEEKAQEIAVEHSETIADRNIKSALFKVTTTANESNFGDALLGANNGKIHNKRLKDAATLNAGNAAQVNLLRDELNRMISDAKMKIEGKNKITKYKMDEKDVGSMSSNAHRGIYIK